MAGLVPRLSGGISRPLEWEFDPMTMARRIASGSREASLQRQLPGIDLRRPFGTVQGVDVAPVQQMNAYAADKREQIGHCLLPGVRQSQQQERDQRDGDLNAHRVLGGADEALDLQTLLDPAEEQLDLPALLVDLGDFVGWGNRDRWSGCATPCRCRAGPEPHASHRTSGCCGGRPGVPADGRCDPTEWSHSTWRSRRAVSAARGSPSAACSSSGA